MLLGRNVSLLAQLEERERRIRELEEQALGANQRRLDVGKRIDDLLAQVDQLDSELAARGE